MIYVLLLFLIAIDILFFILFDRNILSPSVIGTSMFVVSTLFAVVNVNNWKFTISPLTVLVISISLLFLGAGELFVRFCNYRHSQFRKIEWKPDYTGISVRGATIFFIVAVFGLLLVNYYRETVKLAEQAGYKSNSGLLMLAYARTASLNESGDYESRSRIASYSYTFMQAIAYVFSYIFLYNKIVVGKRRCAKYLLPVLLLFPYIGVYGVLRKFDSSIPKFYAPWAEFPSFNGTRGNVYTIIRRYHQDFGYFGLFFLMFCLGAFYSFLFLRLNSTRKNAGLLVYAFIFSPVVEMSIEERFFMNVISLSTLYMVVFTLLIFRVFIKDSGRKMAGYIFKASPFVRTVRI